MGGSSGFSPLAPPFRDGFACDRPIVGGNVLEHDVNVLRMNVAVFDQCIGNGSSHRLLLFGGSVFDECNAHERHGESSLCLCQRQPTVDVDNLTGNMIAAGTEQECDHTGDVVRFS